MLNIKETKNYKFGTVNTLEEQSIPRGAASASLNWLTKGDRIELRRGFRFLGTTSVNSGYGKASGIKKVTDATGIDVLFGTYGKKLKYYSRTLSEWVENGTDLLGSAVLDSNSVGEDISMDEYVGLAGNQMFVNSPNIAGYFKIMIANPTSSTDMYDATKNFKGYIKIDTNRTFLWKRTTDKTGIYGSYIDNQTYTTVSAESMGTGDGSTTTFTATLAFRSGNPKNTCFAVAVTAGAIILTDNYNGSLSASDGSTGTIDYTTGAISVTFATAPVAALAITVAYQHENSNVHGITDFTKGSPRQAGQGFVFRQDEGGGDFQSMNSYNNVYYCMHIKKTWLLNIGSDDTDATNLAYRENVGIPNHRASVETGDGIYYIDDTGENDTRVRILTYDSGGSQQVIPVPVSNNINLNEYRFDQCAAKEWGDYVLFSCRRENSPRNDRTLAYNKLWQSWDTLDYAASCFDTYDGALVAGDAMSDNFLELFSGWDDIESNIVNYWEGNLDSLDLEGLKKSKKLYLQGLIGSGQSIKVSLSVDNGPFTEVQPASDIAAGKHAIEYDGPYVDRTQAVTVGSYTLGRGEVGGGSGGEIAYKYERLINLGLDRFESIKIRYEATGIGYASVSSQKYWDIRLKAEKVPLKYRG